MPLFNGFATILVLQIITNQVRRKKTKTKQKDSSNQVTVTFIPLHRFITVFSLPSMIAPADVDHLSIDLLFIV